MVERRYYRVAGFAFSIAAEPEQLALLTNYQPFAIPASQAPERLFDITPGEVGDVSKAHVVYTDTSDDDMPRIEVYRLPARNNKEDDWLLQVSKSKEGEICTRIRASYDFSDAILKIESADTRFAIDNTAMLLYAFTTADKGVLEMHASVTVKDGRGFLFLGHSGTGKSTHSRLWMEAFEDARLLNDDNPILRVLDYEGQRQMRVYGSPWSGKTPCYINRDVPVGGIVKLCQAPHNKIRLLRMPEAYAYMLSSASGLKIVPAMMDALYTTIAEMIQLIPLHELECLPDTDAARLCETTVNGKK